MLAMNSFPNVLCGHVEDPVDAYTFAHVNDGNAVALPFAKGFGWGGELNLEYIFEKLFGFGHGQGYPKERVVPEQRNKKILDGVRAVTLRPIIDCLKDIDQELVKGALPASSSRSCSSLTARTRSLLSTLRLFCNPYFDNGAFQRPEAALPVSGLFLPFGNDFIPFRRNFTVCIDFFLFLDYTALIIIKRIINC